MVKLSIAISHAADRPERQASLSKLIERLDGHAHIVESTKGHPHVFRDAQWDAALSVQDATHCVFLDDDVLPCERFIDTLTAALEAQPNEIASLVNHHHLAKEAVKEGHRWMTTSDMLVSQAWAIPRGLLLQARAFERAYLVDGCRDWPMNHPRSVTDEDVIILFAVFSDRRIWHTLPALVTHSDGGSLFGHDGDWARTSVIPPRREMPTDWSGDAYYVGRGIGHRLGHMLISIKPEHWRALKTVEKYYELLADLRAAS